MQRFSYLNSTAKYARSVVWSSFTLCQLVWPLASLSNDEVAPINPSCGVEFSAQVPISGEFYSCNRCIDEPSIERVEYQTIGVKRYRTDWPSVPINLVVMRNTGPEQQNDWSSERAAFMVSEANRFLSRANCPLQLSTTNIAFVDAPSSWQDINQISEYEAIRNTLNLFRPTVVLGGLFSIVSSNPRHAVTEYEAGITFLNKYNHDPGLGILLTHELIHAFLNVPNEEHSESPRSLFKAHLSLSDNTTNIGIEAKFCNGLAEYAAAYADNFSIRNPMCAIQ
jgi:hypothetical protein